MFKALLLTQPVPRETRAECVELDEASLPAGAVRVADDIARGKLDTRIGAQAHLQAFYGQHGFQPAGPIYIEDGIDHIEMVRAA